VKITGFGERAARPKYANGGNPPRLAGPCVKTVETARSGRPSSTATESRGVVGFEVILGAYSPLSIAAMDPVSLSG
jgi:hypothetical protein